MRYAMLMSETVIRNARYTVEAPTLSRAIQMAQRGETIIEDTLEDVAVTARHVTLIEEES